MIGSGGVGGYFGARLASGGADVVFLARGAHLAALRSQGIKVEGGPQPLHVASVQATDDPSDMGVADFVLVAVKLWDTEAILERIRPVVGPDTAIISFQNGVLKDNYLRTHYDAAQIMGGVGYVATTIDRPGVIRQTGSMHHDLQRGNPLEVRWLAGGVVELGATVGVPTPLNRAIADILALHAEGAKATAAEVADAAE